MPSRGEKNVRSMASLTARASVLPEGDLALMSAVCRELSSYERDVQLPMLAWDMRMMRKWLLAGLVQHGMLASLSASRREARQEKWAGMCRQCDEESKMKMAWPERGEHDARAVEWKSSPGSTRMRWASHLLFFTHSGVAPGYDLPNQGLGWVEALFINAWGAVVSMLAAAWLGGVWEWSSPWMGAGDGALARMAAGASVFLCGMGLSRALLWAKASESQRMRFEAWAATPWLLRSIRASRARAEKRGAAAGFAQAAGYGQIKDALVRASLGQRSCEEGEKEGVAAMELERLKKESVEALSDPALGLSLDEAIEMALAMGNEQKKAGPSGSGKRL